MSLNEQNYATWKIQMKMYLIRDGLYKIVDGTEVAPSGNVDGSSVLDKFIARKDRALANIVLHIEPKLLYLIGDPTDPAIVWTKLQNTFQKKSWSNKLSLKRKLYNLRLKENDNLQEHLRTFIEIYDALAVVGDAIEEEDKVINLLASLPDNYATIVTALEAMEKVPTWEMVTERLLHEEKKI